MQTLYAVYEGNTRVSELYLAHNPATVALEILGEIYGRENLAIIELFAYDYNMEDN